MENRAGMRRINLIEQNDNQSENGNDQDEDKKVVNVGGAGNQPFMMKGKMNNVPFTTMIDSGSPITIFTQVDLRNIIEQDLIVARPLPKTEHCVDCNNKQTIEPS